MVGRNRENVNGFPQPRSCLRIWSLKLSVPRGPAYPRTLAEYDASHELVSLPSDGVYLHRQPPSVQSHVLSMVYDTDSSLQVFIEPELVPAFLNLMSRMNGKKAHTQHTQTCCRAVDLSASECMIRCCEAHSRRVVLSTLNCFCLQLIDTDGLFCGNHYNITCVRCFQEPSD